MLFAKNTRSKCAACMYVAVGALAVVGALAITNKGRKLIEGATGKIKGVIDKDGCES